MKQMQRLNFAKKVADAKAQYEMDGDLPNFMGNVAAVSLYGIAMGLAETSARYRSLPPMVSAAQYPIRAAAGMIAERLDDPTVCDHTQESWAKHFMHHLRTEFDEDAKAVRAVMERLGMLR